MEIVLSHKIKLQLHELWNVFYFIASSLKYAVCTLCGNGCKKVIEFKSRNHNAKQLPFRNDYNELHKKKRFLDIVML